MHLLLSVWRTILAPVRVGLVWALQRPLSRARAELSTSDERILIPPVPAKFTGASWLRRPRGDGIIALTEGALLFWPLLGAPILVPRGEIEGARLARWFRGYRRAGKEHLVLDLTGGRRIAFIVAVPEEWIRALHGEPRPEAATRN